MGSYGDIETCPNCSSKMKKGKAPFKFHGSYVGKFEAYICGLCGRTYFTERAYKEIMEMPLNSDEANNFSEEVDMPSVTVVSPSIIYKSRKEPSMNIELKEYKKPDKSFTFVQLSEESSEHKRTNTQNNDLEVVN